MESASLKSGSFSPLFSRPDGRYADAIMRRVWADMFRVSMMSRPDGSAATFLTSSAKLSASRMATPCAGELSGQVAYWV